MEFLPEAVVIVEGMRSVLFGCSVRYGCGTPIKEYCEQSHVQRRRYRCAGLRTDRISLSASLTR